MTPDPAPPGPCHTPELSRPLALARIGDGLVFTVQATPEECRALAVRMGLEAIHGLTCRMNLRRGESDSVHASGLLQASVRQICVVSLEPFDATIAEDFSIRFVPAGMESAELDLDSDDEVPYEGGVIEVGEAVSEQLALALDPFPRAPGAELEVAFGVDEDGAFAGLGSLLPRH